MTFRTGTTQRLGALFLLGALLLDFPLLSIFGSGGTVLGLPVIYAYLFGAWALIIAAMAIVIERDR